MEIPFGSIDVSGKWEGAGGRADTPFAQNDRGGESNGLAVEEVSYG